jgi:hypothetical protein
MSWTNLSKPTMTAEYLATEALDYLMTEDGFYLITNQSNVWSMIAKAVTSWTNLSK